MNFLSSSTVSGAAAAIGTAVQATTDNVWGLVVIALSIPLGFYVLHRVIGLFPKTRK